MTLQEFLDKAASASEKRILLAILYVLALRYAPNLFRLDGGRSEIHMLLGINEIHPAPKKKGE